MEDEELDREMEKCRRRKKLERRYEDFEEVEGGGKRKNRLPPYDKRSRKFAWQEEIEDDDDNGN